MDARITFRSIRVGAVVGYPQQARFFLFSYLFENFKQMRECLKVAERNACMGIQIEVRKALDSILVFSRTGQRWLRWLSYMMLR